MRIRTSILIALIAVLLGSQLDAQRTSRRLQNMRNNKKKQAAELIERDPELYQWIDTLILKLGKDHKRIRNSAAQALISVGAEAGPQLKKARDAAQREERRLMTRILQRIDRGSGKNMFKADAGGAEPKKLAEQLSHSLSLKEAQRAKLEKVVASVQEKKREMDRKRRAKKLDGRAYQQQLRRLGQETEAELALFLDPTAVRFVSVKLGLSRPNERERGADGGSAAEEEMIEERRRRARESGGK